MVSKALIYQGNAGPVFAVCALNDGNCPIIFAESKADRRNKRHNGMGKKQFSGFLTRLNEGYGALKAEQRGNAALIFGLSAMVVCAAAGGGIDFARVQTERSHIQDAADAAVLRATAMPRASQTEQEAAANHVFHTTFLGEQKSRAHVEITKTELTKTTTGNRTDITYTTHALVTPLFLGLIGMGEGLPVTVVSKAQAQLRKSEIVLVLDTTGSMANNNRMTNLKSSIGTVLAGMLSEKGTNTSGTKVAVVPFSTQVKIAPATDLSYIDYGQVSASCTNLNDNYCESMHRALSEICDDASNVSSCKSTARFFTREVKNGSRIDYYVIVKANEKSGKNYKIYTYNRTERVQNGTRTVTEDAGSVVTKSSLNDYNSNPSNFNQISSSNVAVKADNSTGYDATLAKAPFPALSANRSAWTGCVSDREQPYDVSEASPTVGVAATRYPARACKDAGDTKLKPIMGLTEDIKSVSDHVNSLQSDGYTNISIGVQWGMEVLSRNMPYSEGVNFRDEETLKYMILVTDGENTENRWESRSGGSTSKIDARTKLACEAARAQGITVFVVRVMEGNTKLLRECASRPEYFYDLKSADQLGQALLDVFNTMKKTRLTQ